MAGDSRQWSRRQILGGSAGLAIAGLAGCSSDAGQGGQSGGSGTNSGGSGNAGGNASGNSSGGSNSSGEVFAYAFARAPTEVQFNRYNVGNWGQSLQDQIYHQVARGYSDGSVGSEFLEELSADGKTLTLKFPKGFSWWEGRDVTAEDYYVGLEIDRLQNPEESSIQGNNLVDDYTIEINFKNQRTPFLMKAEVAETFVNTPRWIFQEYLDQLESAGSQDERDSVFNDLSTMQISTQQVVDEGLGNGLFKLDSFNSSKTVMTLFEDHPYADRTSIQKVNLIPEIGGNLTSMIASNQLDMQPNTLINQSTRSQFPDNLQNAYEYDWFRMQKFTFNWNSDHMGRRPVRRAIAHAVNLTPIVQAMKQAGTNGSPVETQTGIRPSIYERYLGEGWADQLIQYPTDSDNEGATRLMENAGYSKDGNNWVDPDGNSFSLSILTQNAPQQTQATKVFSDQLNDFGLQTEISSVDSTDYYQRLQSYEDDIYWIWHVAVALWHPIAYFSNDFYGVLAGNPSSDSDTGPTGVPFSLEIPEKVGAKEVQNGGRTIKPAELMNSLPTASTLEETRQKTRTLVQWFNYDLPGLVFVEENAGSWLDTGTFSMQTKGHNLNTDRPGQVALKNGWIDLK